MKIKIEVSARHIHLCQEDLEQLFGKVYELKKAKDLSQSGQYACEEVLKVVGPKNSIDEVRVIGPCRSRTQVEVSKTDGYFLGDIPPVRVSGDVIGSSPVKLIGPGGEINLKEGLIMSMRHVHISDEKAEELGLKNKQMVSVACSGDRDLIFNNVIVRVESEASLCFQVDTDEANAADVETGDVGELILE